MNAQQVRPTQHDLVPWGGAKSVSNDVDGLIAGLLNNGGGVHRFELISNVYLDCYAKGFDGFEVSSEKKIVLVGLNGAVSNRLGKKPPFFSGLGIHGEMNLPLLAISDPALSLDDELPIAWYAGFQNLEDLPSRIASLLDALSERMNVRFVLFGASGGGFAALSILNLMESDVSALVWNPQTAIHEYAPIFVKQYLGVAFPFLTEDVDDLIIKDCLEKTGIIYNLRQMDNLGDGKKLLYLQNKSDWHYARHAMPFLANMHLGDNFEGRWCKGIYFLSCDFGVGHVGPTKDGIVSSLKFLMDKLDESLFLSLITKPHELITTIL